MIPRTRCILVALVCFFLSLSAVCAHAKPEKDPEAIVLATFGTTVPGGLKAILHVKERIQKKCPGTEIRLAFTSNMIRRVWHKRQHDDAFKKENPEVPADIFLVKGPLATIADLQDDGFTTLLVQSGHLNMGEEYHDLVSCVDGLNAITAIKEKNRPFVKLAVSRPVLGTMGTAHPYGEDIKSVAQALAGDAQKAKTAKSALLYMAHGNEFYPSSGAYLELMEVMNAMYPETKSYITAVEGFPSLATVIDQMKKDKVTRVLLKPFLLVAGDHALNDMAGESPNSVKSVLKKNGFEVVAVVEGMGEQDAFADIFVDHLAETAADNGITLK